MRVVIVSRDIPPQPGLYLGPSTEQKEDAELAVQAIKALKAEWDRTGDGRARTRASMAAATGAATATAGVATAATLGGSLIAAAALLPLALLAAPIAIGGFALWNSMTAEDRKLTAAYLLGLSDGRKTPAEAALNWARTLVGRANLAPPSREWIREEFENHCITIIGPSTKPLSYVPLAVEPLLAGHFPAQAQVDAVLAEGGGTTRIHAFNLHEARGLLRRHGGGTIEEGMYLLHPKREDVIVPFHTFHADMLAEMTREARVVMGRIGAKSLIIDTVEGVTFGGEVVSRVPLKSGSVGADYEKNTNRRVSYEWGSPTFDPDHALRDCVWIQDNAGVMTIVDQRKTSNLTRYEEFSKIDTSFKLSIDIMKLFATGFQWAETSTYRYEVQFFDKRA